MGMTVVTLEDTIIHPTWGETNVTIEVSVSGRYRAATLEDPPEYPEVEITDIIISDKLSAHFGEPLPIDLWPSDLQDVEKRALEQADKLAEKCYDYDDILETQSQGYYKDGQYW